MKTDFLSKIYIVCPANSTTGGPEALHQLSHKLKTVLNYDVRMFYTNKKKGLNPKPEIYNIYYTKETSEIIDKENDVLIIPESLTYYIYKYTQIQKIVWWLSVDFYAICMKNRHRGLNFYVSKYILRKKEIKEYLLEDLPNVYHWAQSYRSYLYLLKKGIPEEKIARVCDYMNPIFISKDNQESNINHKDNIIIYNPKKGKKAIDLIKKQCRDYPWIPIQGMTPLQVSNLMKRAKLYIDFGYNPGRDRMLRESALMNCIIISGTGGSSKFTQDLNIPDKYKFEYSKAKILEIVAKIKEVLNNYDTCISDFNTYKEEIISEEKLFENQLRKFFNE